MSLEEDEIAVGIDLGTTTSGIAFVKKGQPTMIRAPNGDRTIPSMVAFTDEGYLVGQEALQYSSNDPTNSLYQTKQLIGRLITDSTVQADIKKWPFNIQADKTGKPQLRVQNRNSEELISAEQISTRVLKELTRMAMEHLRREVKKVVITIPIAFTDAQRRGTLEAAEKAGLEVLRIIDESTAAALAYVHENEPGNVEKNKVVVFDIGGSTCNVSILEINKGECKVLNNKGDTHLGGGDFDSRLMEYIKKKLMDKHGIKANLKDHPRDIWRLRTACEEAKKQLSVDESCFVNLDGFVEGENNVECILRNTFEKICEDLFERIRKLINQCLKESDLTKDDIEGVLLVGGSTRIPKIKKLLTDLFDGDKVRETINPDEAVALGASIQAALILKIKLAVYVDPRDRLPHRLGIHTIGGQISEILNRDISFPVSRTKVYATTENNQTEITITVVEGDDPYTENNMTLAQFSIGSLPPKPAGREKILVTFNVDAKRVLTVSAVSATTGERVEAKKIELIKKESDSQRLPKGESRRDAGNPRGEPKGEDAR